MEDNEARFRQYAENELAVAVAGIRRASDMLDTLDINEAPDRLELLGEIGETHFHTVRRLAGAMIGLAGEEELAPSEPEIKELSALSMFRLKNGSRMRIDGQEVSFEVSEPGGKTYFQELEGRYPGRSPKRVDMLKAIIRKLADNIDQDVTTQQLRESHPGYSPGDRTFANDTKTVRELLGESVAFTHHGNMSTYRFKAELLRPEDDTANQEAQKPPEQAEAPAQKAKEAKDEDIESEVTERLRLADGRELRRHADGSISLETTTEDGHSIYLDIRQLMDVRMSVERLSMVDALITELADHKDTWTRPAELRQAHDNYAGTKNKFFSADMKRIANLFGDSLEIEGYARGRKYRLLTAAAKPPTSEPAGQPSSPENKEAAITKLFKLANGRHMGLDDGGGVRFAEPVEPGGKLEYRELGDILSSRSADRLDMMRSLVRTLARSPGLEIETHTLRLSHAGYDTTPHHLYNDLKRLEGFLGNSLTINNQGYTNSHKFEAELVEDSSAAEVNGLVADGSNKSASKTENSTRPEEKPPQSESKHPDDDFSKEKITAVGRLEYNRELSLLRELPVSQAGEIRAVAIPENFKTLLDTIMSRQFINGAIEIDVGVIVSEAKEKMSKEQSHLATFAAVRNEVIMAIEFMARNFDSIEVRKDELGDLQLLRLTR